MQRKNKKANKKNESDPKDYWTIKQELERKSIKLFDQILFHDWCKGCGICISFCTKKVYVHDKTGKPLIDKTDACNGCRFCEQHCPDFAITIKQRYVDRRKRLNGNNFLNNKTFSSRK